MKQNKDWTDVMRSALRDAELPPPAGGWERLQRELGGAAPVSESPAEVSPRDSVWRIYWPRFTAAAAAVLICVVAGEFLLRSDKALEHDGTVIASAVESGTTAVSIPQQAEPESVRELLAQAVSLPAELPVESSSLRGRALLAATCQQPVETAALVEMEQDTTPLHEEVVAEQPAASEPKPKIAVPTNAQSRSAAASTAGSSTKAMRRTTFADEPFVAYTKTHKKAAFSLFAGGGVTGGSNGTLGPQQQYNSVMSDVSSLVGNGNNMRPLQRNNYAESSFRHHQPLSFGLAVRKEFAYGLSLESGVNYTLLRSDVRMQYSSEDVSQKLHFIGVPLRLNWQFFERGRFSLYVGTGGMVEKCVSAKFGSKTMDEPDVQWSALVAAGAQYRLGGLVGLYFEPEGSYYFTKTELRTSRTDSPLTLTLRLGVRLSF